MKKDSSEKIEISTENAPGAVGPYSQGIRTGNFVCISGQLPIDPATGNMPDDVSEQAEQSIKNLTAVLKAGGCGLNDVVKTTVYLSDIKDFEAVNAVYANHFEAPYPARAAFQVACLPKQARVEIEAFAYTKAG